MSTFQSGLRSVSLEQLAILNTEISALVNAGVPLHRGLLDFGRDVPGRLGAITRQIGARLERGEDLVTILADPSTGIPAAYIAVLEAGVRSGHLPVALQGIASSIRQAADVHRMVRLSLLYPLIVSVMAYAALGLFFHNTVPVLLSIYDDSRLQPVIILEWLRWAWESLAYLFPVPPMVLGGALLVWWWRGGRAKTLDQAASARWASPGRMRYVGQLATFSEVLALLVEQEVPLPDAVVLAAKANSDRTFVRDAESLASRLRDGMLAATAGDRKSTIPARIQWALQASPNPKALGRSLRSASRAYREQAQEIESRLNLLVPVLMVVIVGGSALLMYGLVSLAPWYMLLNELGNVH